MSIAIPTFGSRVAPTFVHCETLRIVRRIGSTVVCIETLRTAGLTEDERIKLLEDHKVSLLICGGIGRELADELKDRGVEVVPNVAGEIDQILEHLAGGRLRSGCGITYRPSPPDSQVADNDSENAGAAIPKPAGESPSNPLDCVECSRRVCTQGMTCPHQAAGSDGPAIGGGLRQILDVATDIASEPERILCRISELVYFCLGMKYKHIGVAFCIDLFSEAEVIVQLLRRFVRVTAVCCRVGSPAPADEEESDHGAGPRCHPVEMARILNRERTDLNVLIGLCMGSDLVFLQHSEAPTTTLFVKDRLLANNPIAAVHSRYVLQQVLSGA